MTHLILRWALALWSAQARKTDFLSATFQCGALSLYSAVSTSHRSVEAFWVYQASFCRDLNRITVEPVLTSSDRSLVLWPLPTFVCQPRPHIEQMSFRIGEWKNWSTVYQYPASVSNQQVFFASFWVNFVCTPCSDNSEFCLWINFIGQKQVLKPSWGLSWEIILRLFLWLWNGIHQFKRLRSNANK